MFSFLDDFISSGCGLFSLLPGKYFSSGVNVLIIGLKISNITKKGFLQLTFSESNGRG